MWNYKYYITSLNYRYYITSLEVGVRHKTIVIQYFNIIIIGWLFHDVEVEVLIKRASNGNEFHVSCFSFLCHQIITFWIACRSKLFYRCTEMIDAVVRSFCLSYDILSWVHLVAFWLTNHRVRVAFLVANHKAPFVGILVCFVIWNHSYVSLRIIRTS